MFGVYYCGSTDRCSFSFSSSVKLRFRLTLSGAVMAVDGTHGARVVLLILSMCLGFVWTGVSVTSGANFLASDIFFFSRRALLVNMMFFCNFV